MAGDTNVYSNKVDISSGHLSIYLWYIIGGVSVFVLVVAVLSAVGCYLRRQRAGGERSIELPALPRSTVLQLASVQPEGEMRPHLTRKRLQERRGPGSLRLSLRNSQLDQESPADNKLMMARKRSAEAALYNASRCMSRGQLRHSLHNMRMLYSDFWSLPTNHPERIEVSGSGLKNRYKTILPNEATRVLLPELPDDPLASYINANYISGYNDSKKTYIATQGPMPHTTEDFWRMVWQERSPAIVMLTRLQDKNKVKCANYLPDSPGRQLTYGDISVLCEQLVQRDGYVVFHLLMQRGNETRRVKHYWDRAWSDHRAPRSARHLLNLVQELNTQVK